MGAAGFAVGRQGVLGLRPAMEGALLLALVAAVAALSSAERQPADAPGSAPALRTTPAIDVGAVVETVRHRIVSRAGGLGAEDALYRVAFRRDGFSLTLRLRPPVGRLRAPSRSPHAGATPPSAVAFERSAAAAFSVTGLRLGGPVVDLAPEAWRADANVAERRLATGVVERVSAREGHLEWDVVLARPPSGDGPVRVDARVAGGGDPTVISRDGVRTLRFALGGGRALHVGTLVVKDARGRELFRALPHASGDSVSLVVPASAMRGASYPVTLDPVVSPEYAASDPVYQAAPGDQLDPSLAWSGTGSLVAWQDRRDGADYDVFAARVDADGRVLDLGGIAVSEAAGDQTAPVVAWNGTRFLVAWADARSGSSTDIYAARVSVDGAVLDAAGIPVSAAANSQVAPTAGAAGSTFLVAWQDGRSGTSDDVYAARVSSAGALLDAAGIAVSTAANDQAEPAAASDGTGFLVTWQDRRSGASDDIYASRVSSAGAALDAAGIAVSTAAGNQVAPALAFGGGNYLVVWSDGRATPADLYASRVTPGGSILDAAGIAVSTVPGSQHEPAVTWNGSSYFAVWTDERTGVDSDLFGAHVSTLGAVTEPGGIEIAAGAGDQDSPSLSANGTNMLAVWTAPSGVGTGTEAYAMMLSAAGDALQSLPTQLTSIANVQHDTAVAWNGTTFLVVWEEIGSTTSDIYGARVTAAGTVLDGSGIVITEPSEQEEDTLQKDPAVAAVGSEYFVAWSDSSGPTDDVYGTRISPAGTVITPNGFKISGLAGNETDVALAASPNTYLVTWLRAGTSPGVYAARVSSAGVVLDATAKTVTTAGSTFGGPAAAWNGTNFLVGWSALPSGGTHRNVYAARMSAAGTVLDPSGITVSTAAGDQVEPSAASNGSDYFLAWQDGRSGSDTDVFGARVSTAGAVVDASGIQITTPATTVGAQHTAAAWNGSNYVVAWDEARLGQRDVYATRVSGAGAVLDGSGQAVAAGPDSETAPAAAGGPTGLAALPYVRFARGALYGGAERVFLRTFDEGGGQQPLPICSRSGATLTIFVPNDASVSIGRSGSNFNVIGGGNVDPSCGGSTMTNVDTVSVLGTAGDEALTIDLSGGQFAPGLTAEGTGTHEIEFSLDLAGGMDTLTIQGGTANDTITAGTSGIALNTDADVDVTGTGTAEVSIMNGGAGADKLSAGGKKYGTGNESTSPFAFNGGDAKDTMTTGAAADVFNGGAQADSVTYAARTAALVASIDGVANDGGNGGGEGDNIGLDVENVTGGKGVDTITGSAAANALNGANGNDVLNGGDGNDTLKGGNNDDTLNGDGGADKLYGQAGSDAHAGGEGNDTLDSRDNVGGNDTLNGGNGSDTCLTDPGDVVTTC